MAGKGLKAERLAPCGEVGEVGPVGALGRLCTCGLGIAVGEGGSAVEVALFANAQRGLSKGNGFSLLTRTTVIVSYLGVLVVVYLELRAEGSLG